MESRTISVKVKTRSKSPGVTAETDGTYTVRTSEIPDRGRANEDVIKQLADYFETPKNCITIVGGHATSRKRIRITI